MEFLTVNQYYKGLNNRFDNRIKLLYKAGFKYYKEQGFFLGNTRKIRVNLSFIMHADKRAFNDEFYRKITRYGPGYLDNK